MTSAAEGGRGFRRMLTVADKGGGGEGGLSLADVSKNTKILAKNCFKSSVPYTMR